MARQEVRSLTGLRGLAAFFVVLYHFTRFDNVVVGPALSGSQFLSHGYLSVDLFFVLSGFIMALTYYDMFSDVDGLGGQRTRAAIPIFLGHRIARIYPLYIVMTLIMAAIHYAPFTHSDPIPGINTVLVANLFLVQSWDMARSMVSPAWSISTEWAAYLLFPLLLAVYVSGSRRLAWAAGLLAAAVCLWIATTTQYGTPHTERSGLLDFWRPTSLAPLLRCLVEFCFGLLTFRFYRTASTAWMNRFAAISPLVLAGMVGACLWPDTDLVWLALVPLLILGLAQDRGMVAGVLAWRPVHGLGVLSYSIYLVHPMLTKAVKVAGEALEARDVPYAPAIAVTVGCALVVVCAYAAYRIVERPGRRMLRRVFDRIEWTRGPALAMAPPKRTA